MVLAKMSRKGKRAWRRNVDVHQVGSLQAAGPAILAALAI